MSRLSVLPLFLLLTGCVSMPAALQGEFAPIQPAEAARSGEVGVPVRWGGRVVQVQPLERYTCFEIVGVRLDDFGRPFSRDRSSGRFLACRGGFYDPEVFLPGREVTISGRVDGFENRRIGGYDYRYPRLAADVIFLWPGRPGIGAIVEPPPAAGW